MQEYNRIEDTEYISDAPSQLNKNMESIATDFSGASFPTENLFVGMKCLRTDENKIYRLYENASNQLVWQLEYTIVDGGIKVKQAEQAEQATNDANGKDISTYVAKLESDVNNAFCINVYDGNDNKLGSVTIPETKVEIMTGASSSSAGKEGLVPQPKAGDNDKFLCGDGSFKEAGKVKSVNGKTGDVVVDLPVGHMYWSVEPNVPAGRLPAMGATYNRALYADLWAWANSVGLVKSESEWQAIASANDGNCAYYSSGDGSTTFRVPSLKCWIKGASGVEEVGSYLQAGLPNITGNLGIGNWNIPEQYTTGAFKHNGTAYNTAYWDDEWTSTFTFDASRSNSIYGNSDTVQPPSIVGMFLIVAFGVAHNIGNADVANVMQAVETAQTVASEANSKIDGIVDYIVESYRNGNQWYEIYKSGKVRQGGITTTIAEDEAVYITLLKKMGNTNYSVFMTQFGEVTGQYTNGVAVITKATNRFQIKHANYATKYFWVAEGQGE